MRRSSLRKLLLAFVLVAALAAAFQFWFRDSSLVAVEKVTVVGLDRDGTRSTEIRESLVSAGQTMTTLAMDEGVLARSVRQYPEVRQISADAMFPDSLEVDVDLREPVARIGEGDDSRPVSADGVILDAGYARDQELPQLPLNEAPDKAVVDGPIREQVTVLASAPREFLAVIEGTSYAADTGPVVTLEAGIELRFGDAARAQQKWQAAVAVLTDPALERLTYIDLASPRRPSVGGEEHELPSNW